MIIRQLQLRDFGPYADFQVFNFTPGSEGTYNRPLVLVTGKNGVGKSTVMEAVRLCLHGSLALGRSVSREQYRTYLEARIHRPATGSAEPDKASIALVFDHVVLGRRRRYEVRRSWSRRASGVMESLMLAENGVPIDDLSDDQKETYLRDLVPACVTDLFLLDNEKLGTLSSDTTSSALLAEMVQSLLGLDLVHRLQRDLDVYLVRAAGGNDSLFREELESALRDEQRIGQALEATEAQLRSTEGEIHKLRVVIEAHQHRIAQEGHGFSEQLAELHAKKDTLGAEVTRQRAVIQDMAAGLMPFAITPKFCQLVIERLEDEEQLQRAVIARELIDRAAKFLSNELGKPDLWAGLVVPPKKAARLELAKRIGETLSKGLGGDGPDSGGLLLHASDQDRTLLTTWAHDSRHIVPEQFCQAVALLRDLECDLIDTETQLAQIPSQETLAPLVQELNCLHHQLGTLQAKEETLKEQHRKQAFEHKQAAWRVRSARLKLQEAGKGQRTVELAAKTQSILEEYTRELLDQKLQLLEQAIAERFNQLCRKPAFVTQVSIDRESFGLTLYRYGHAFDRSDLSAGEKQLFATAILWAMRDVSRLPIPVFIDTPVARLDADHREAMMETFLPHVSHQTVLLATDAEADAVVIDNLEPLLARIYKLEYDLARGATLVSLSDLTTEHSPSLELEMAP